ncbi:hypothetical protein CSB45_09905 [candidate division KSB3 bacterium]|uniref:Uncharacterized protein n=1 Tax=candidate division KSB3 bacterium TaxID=2044937 RepID=A0A2G6E3V8_9BACT|nr:MAG: hypothetical protein CSB45_09905 [candidate division KSB3 bacterium]PIE29368.1 MAG: hypothetical protein CSA57_09185 [candidate division KSB3 bacterium]
MRLQEYLFEVAPRAPLYELARRGLIRSPNPLTITYSVTAACRSLCKTCNIGRTYLENPERAKRDLTLDEIEKTFRHLGHIYFFNVSGGEPFMRMDLPEICRLAFIHLKPRLISIPTNSLAPRAIEKSTLKILDYMEELLPDSVFLSVKPSIDGVGEMHDYLRGIKGNFVKLEETIDRLLALRSKNPRLHVDLGSVISNFNLHHLHDLEDWVHQRGIEAYRHEIAEQRVEFHNIGDPITPSPEIYEKLTLEFAEKIVRNIKEKGFFTRVTEAIRISYYHVAVEILRQRRQVTPCYGGLANIHMDHDGEMWACCILGGEQSMGNVRDWDYDVPALLNSEQAKTVKKYIADGNCACPLASQWLNNVLLTPRHMLRVLYTLFVRFPLAKSSSKENKPARKINPKDVKVRIRGTSPRSAIVQEKAGVISAPKNADLPFFEIEAAETAAQDTPLPSKFPKSLHRVESVRDLTSSTCLLQIERNGLHFIPGQYAMLGKPGSFEAREYTIYSGVQDTQSLKFLITVVDGGRVSQALRNCVAGEILELEGPMGYFQLEKPSAAKKHYFIATGSGIAPFHAFTQSEAELNFTLLHGVRWLADCYHKDDYDPQRYISCVSRQKGGDFYGRVSDYLKTQTLAPDVCYYLCGNCDMIYDVHDILTEKGVPHNQIKTEIFY